MLINVVQWLILMCTRLMGCYGLELEIEFWAWSILKGIQVYSIWWH